MKTDQFRDLNPFIESNPNLRLPQIESYVALRDFWKSRDGNRELSVILPVGCGKTGSITLTPFAFKSQRTLVIAPSLKISEQLCSNFDPTHPDYFYRRFGITTGTKFPEPVEIRGETANRKDLDLADVVITNIHQIQGLENRWIQTLPNDYFDLIIFDEGHHSLASTWQLLKEKFSKAYIINFTATPERADGKKMTGRIIYSFPIAKAVMMGYVKNLKGLVLNPQTLKYVRIEDGVEVEVELEEVIRLGDNESDFRRSILTSEETLNTIVKTSIQELDKIRIETNDHRPKIIASALNFAHCKQIVEAYKANGKRCDMVHSKLDSQVNERIYRKLESHQLDVIVQVKKLGEGFDHPFLSVAAVFSIHATLSPFVQFIGRIMRTIDQNPLHPLNKGTVVFHAGANIARRWSDFKEFSQADQEYFDTLFPLDGLDFSNSTALEIIPEIDNMFSEEAKSPSSLVKTFGTLNTLNSEEASPFEKSEFSYASSNIIIKEQNGMEFEEIPLIENSVEAHEAIETLKKLGFNSDQVKKAMDYPSVVTTKMKKRQETRFNLNESVKAEVMQILSSKNLKPNDFDLDSKYRRKNNFTVLKSVFDISVNKLVGSRSENRSELSQEELDLIESKFEEISASVQEKIFQNT
ncbi:DEAD/DEAH box helicase [Leptospira santarosai]|uniref:DEAD/DEAH box helicase n=1 Tax=Leptospira santarosai TaxID=28183 RepID=UPI0002489D86|nr:DEAD/DEAH box helicase family protein [Leptospira santarosai]EMM77504.1 type III restriction enzyme, res subunit [Leptospira santarosai str. 2000030832]